MTFEPSNALKSVFLYYVIIINLYICAMNHIIYHHLT